MLLQRFNELSEDMQLLVGKGLVDDTLANLTRLELAQIRGEYGRLDPTHEDFNGKYRELQTMEGVYMDLLELIKQATDRLRAPRS